MLFQICMTYFFHIKRDFREEHSQAPITQKNHKSSTNESKSSEAKQ